MHRECGQKQPSALAPAPLPSPAATREPLPCAVEHNMQKKGRKQTNPKDCALSHCLWTLQTLQTELEELQADTKMVTSYKDTKME